jgi:hypothetical protein
MSSRLSLVLFPLIFSLLFAGCSFEDIFAKLATSNVEQGASEAFARSKIVEAKQQKIDQMKQQFVDSVELQNVTESNTGKGYAFRKIESQTILINVEVMLPDAGRQIYEVWLRQSGGKEKLRLGALQFNQTDDYSFAYTGTEDLSKYSTITISREAVPDDIQETLVMTGNFK